MNETAASDGWSVNVGGIIAIIIFYVLILLVGLWAAKKSQFKGGKINSTSSSDSSSSNSVNHLPAQITESEDAMLAGRNIGVFVGIFTMTATWVGGGYINGTAELVYNPDYGLLWCLAPVGYALSLIFGGLLFAKRMRLKGYVTMLDPFQEKYGERMGGLLFLPAVLGELFWSAAILAALGATLSVIINLDNTVATIISACIVLFYTLFGGLYSVAYTDVVQLFCIFIGLWICIPFTLTHSAVQPINRNVSRWFGSVKLNDLGIYFDTLLMLIFGGIPWQVYFQRVLSSKTPRNAQILSFVAAIGCFIMAIPSVLIGAVAASTNWTETGYPRVSIPFLLQEDQKLVLPLVLQYLCPPVVSFIGLGAVSAAVMSSADSSILSAASMFARNIYRAIFIQGASERHVMRVMQGSIFVIGALATLMGIYIPSIYTLWAMSADLVYVILFPQLVCVIYFNFTNTYGSLAGYIVGLFLRISVGEELLQLPPLIRFPWFSALGEVASTNIFEQRFPVKTLAMLLSMLTVIAVSWLMNLGFYRFHWSKKWDVFHCMYPRSVTIRTDEVSLEKSSNDQKKKENETLIDTHNSMFCNSLEHLSLA